MIGPISIRPSFEFGESHILDLSEKNFNPARPRKFPVFSGFLPSIGTICRFRQATIAAESGTDTPTGPSFREAGAPGRWLPDWNGPGPESLPDGGDRPQSSAVCATWNRRDIRASRSWMFRPCSLKYRSRRNDSSPALRGSSLRNSLTVESSNLDAANPTPRQLAQTER